MEQILLAYGLLKETVTAIMMIYKNTKVRSPDGDTNFFDIVVGVLQEDILASYLFIIYPRLCAATVDRFNERRWLFFDKARSSWYPIQTITDVDYANNKYIRPGQIQAPVVSLLQYGCIIWTLTKRMEKKLDENCTRMLQVVLNKSWSYCTVTNHLSWNPSKLYKKIMQDSWKSKD